MKKAGMVWKILIADDEWLERKGIETLLCRRKLPVEVYHASDGEEAFSILCGEKMDLLISDVKMPRLNGLELCRKAREMDPDLVIILQSAYDDFEFMRAAIQVHVDDYMLKPVSIEEFDKVIDQALRKLEQRKGEELVSESLAREGRIVRDVLQVIEDHYGENIGLEWIAAQVKLSSGYLSSLFKMEYGQGLTQYLIAYRMEKAKELVCHTDLRVAEIGQQVGYPSTSYFCQQFKKYHGVTPNRMREKCQK